MRGMSCDAYLSMVIKKYAQEASLPTVPIAEIAPEIDLFRASPATNRFYEECAEQIAWMTRKVFESCMLPEEEIMESKVRIEEVAPKTIAELVESSKTNPRATKDLEDFKIARWIVPSGVDVAAENLVEVRSLPARSREKIAWLVRPMSDADAKGALTSSACSCDPEEALQVFDRNMVVCLECRRAWRMEAASVGPRRVSDIRRKLGLVPLTT
jgi:hypothetical protein